MRDVDKAFRNAEVLLQPMRAVANAAKQKETNPDANPGGPVAEIRCIRKDRQHEPDHGSERAGKVADKGIQRVHGVSVFGYRVLNA